MKILPKNLKTKSLKKQGLLVFRNTPDQIEAWCKNNLGNPRLWDNEQRRALFDVLKNADLEENRDVTSMKEVKDAVEATTKYCELVRGMIEVRVSTYSEEDEKRVKGYSQFIQSLSIIGKDEERGMRKTVRLLRHYEPMVMIMLVSSMQLDRRDNRDEKIRMIAQGALDHLESRQKYLRDRSEQTDELRSVIERNEDAEAFYTRIVNEVDSDLSTQTKRVLEEAGFVFSGPEFKLLQRGFHLIEELDNLTAGSSRSTYCLPTEESLTRDIGGLESFGNPYIESKKEAVSEFRRIAVIPDYERMFSCLFAEGTCQVAS